MWILHFFSPYFVCSSCLQEKQIEKIGFKLHSVKGGLQIQNSQPDFIHLQTPPRGPFFPPDNYAFNWRREFLPGPQWWDWPLFTVRGFQNHQLEQPDWFPLCVVNENWH